MSPHELGTAIRLRRKALHLTQEDLADLVGVNRRLVSELERGTGSAALRTALAVCNALGLDLIAQPVASDAS